MAYSASDAAGQIFPIIGAGIGIGVLAHTARGVTDIMYEPRKRRRTRRGRKPRAKSLYDSRRPPIRNYKPRYGFEW